MTDWKKLAEDKLELKAAWEGLEIPFEYPTKQIPLWLLDYGKDMIISGFKTLKAKEDKVEDPAAYLATNTSCLPALRHHQLHPQGGLPGGD